ncbi:MAG: YHYH domain-containing protein [Clostridia bacterium]|nr:YHYH domain-containing protein [Clostridia bacterium]
MKKHLVLILALLTLLWVCAIVVSAHPGGTDENGGHYDYSTGEYHYHHGYSAHDHIDGECVFEDSDSSNTSSRTKSKKDNKDSTPIWAYILIGSLLALFIVPGAVTGIREGIREIKKKPNRDNWFVMVMMILAILFGFVVPIVVSVLVA